MPRAPSEDPFIVTTKPLKKAVLPVAGLGTRFLPATKAMAKEMLPIVDKPLIQYAVEEARAAGIEQFCFVTGRGKTALVEHFDVAYELERTLEERGKRAELELLRGAAVEPGSIVTVRQQGQMPSPVVLKVRFGPGTAPIRAMANAKMTDPSTAVVTWPVDVWFNGSRTFQATLDATQEVPPVAVPSTGTGSATVTLDDETGIAEYSISFQNLTGRPVAAHFHPGVPGTAGPPLGCCNLDVTSATGPSGTLAGTSGQLTPENIERVEVMRGSGGTMYGSEAIGGVIQIFTRKGMGPPRGSIEVSGGNASTDREVGEVSGESGIFSFSGSASHIHTEGFRPENDDYSNTAVSGSLDTKVVEDGTARVSFRLNDSEFGNFFNNNFLAAPDPNARQKDQNDFTHAEWDHAATKQLRYRLGCRYPRSGY